MFLSLKKINNFLLKDSFLGKLSDREQMSVPGFVHEASSFLSLLRLSPGPS